MKALVSLAFISISCQQKLRVHIKAFSCQSHLSSAASHRHAPLGSWRGVATGNEEGHTGGGGQGVSSEGLKCLRNPLASALEPPGSLRLPFSSLPPLPLQGRNCCPPPLPPHQVQRPGRQVPLEGMLWASTRALLNTRTTVLPGLNVEIFLRPRTLRAMLPDDLRKCDSVCNPE